MSMLIIFSGAPGTGETELAHLISAPNDGLWRCAVSG
jgi:cytidylate kinase